MKAKKISGIFVCFRAGISPKNLFYLLAAVVVLPACTKEFLKPEPPADVRLFGGEMNEAFEGITILPNGEMVVCGTIQVSEEAYDVLVMKLDASGNLLDSNTIDIDDIDHGLYVIPYQSGYAILGASDDLAHGSYAYFIIILNENLQVIQTAERILVPGSSYYYGPAGFEATPDGNFIIISCLSSSQSVLLVSPDGTILKQTVHFTESNGPYGNVLTRLDSNTWVFCFEYYGLRLVAFDQNLDSLWSTETSAPGNEITYSVIASQGKIYTSGFQYNVPLIIRKFSSTGVFENAYSPDEGPAPFHLAADANGLIWMSGDVNESSSGGFYNVSPFLLSMDSLGNFSTLMQMEGEREDRSHCLAVSPSGQKIVGGSGDSFGGDGLSAFIWIK